MKGQGFDGQPKPVGLTTDAGQPISFNSTDKKMVIPPPKRIVSVVAAQPRPVGLTTDAGQPISFNSTGKKIVIPPPKRMVTAVAAADPTSFQKDNMIAPKRIVSKKRNSDGLLKSLPDDRPVASTAVFDGQPVYNAEKESNVDVKRLVKHAPAGQVVVTVSDRKDVKESSVTSVKKTAGQPDMVFLTSRKSALPVLRPCKMVKTTVIPTLRFPDAIINASRDIDYGLYTIVESSLYSCLNPDQVDAVSEVLRLELSPLTNKRILECGSNAGCDAINLARIFSDSIIYAIEHDRATFECLERNVKTMTAKYPNLSKIVPVHADGVAYLRKNKVDADIVYVDPPWGGREYWKADQLELHVSGIPLVDFAHELISKHSPVVVLKLPPSQNFDMLAFAALSTIATLALYQIQKKEKENGVSHTAFKLLVLKRKTLV